MGPIWREVLLRAEINQYWSHRSWMCAIWSTNQMKEFIFLIETFFFLITDGINSDFCRDSGASQENYKHKKCTGKKFLISTQVRYFVCFFKQPHTSIPFTNNLITLSTGTSSWCIKCKITTYSTKMSYFS